jgi:transcriptional regulator with XRE-family HTH domain
MKMAFGLATTDEILRTLGQRMRSHRLAQGLPQQELASMAGLSLGALRKLEANGHSSMETWVRVSQALGIVRELQDLFLPRIESIEHLDRLEDVASRQRAPRRRAR